MSGFESAHNQLCTGPTEGERASVPPAFLVNPSLKQGTAGDAASNVSQ